MWPIAYLDISLVSLDRGVQGEIWAGWVAAEPSLGVVSSLGELRALPDVVADVPLGALVRLAAQDSGDDPLAGVAVALLLEGGAAHLMRSLGDLSDDIEADVLGALWIQIRTFPWRRRTHAYAANLILDTRTAVLKQLLPGHGRRSIAPLVLVDPQGDLEEDQVIEDPWCGCGPGSACEESARELVDLLEWALASQVIGVEDVALLLELIAAGDAVADMDTARTLRGACSQAAVLRVADAHGVSTRTVRRHRDRVMASLRDSATSYLNAVA